MHRHPLRLSGIDPRLQPSVRALVTAGLPGAPPRGTELKKCDTDVSHFVQSERKATGPEAESDPGTAGAFAEWVIANRVSNLALDTMGDVFPAGERARVRDDARLGVRQVLLQDRAFAELAERFAALDVDHRVLKGAATSRIAYQRRVHRWSADIDAIVRPADFPRVVEAFAADAREENFVPLGPADARHRKARSFLLPSGLWVDLHQAVQGPVRSMAIPIEAVFERPQPIPVGDLEVRAPSLEVLFLHAALHLASEGAKATTLIDLLRLAHHPALDAPRAAAMLPTRSGRAAVRWALGLAGEWNPLPPAVVSAFGLERHRHHRAMERVASSPALARALDRFAGPARFARITETAWPSRAVLAERGLTRGQHVRRLGRLVTARQRD